MKSCSSGDASAQSRREAILEAVSFAATRFLGPHEWKEAIEPALARLGEATQVSRVSIFENHLGQNAELLTSQRSVWAAPDVESHVDNPVLQSFPWRGMGMDRWAETLTAGQIIAGHVKDFPQSERDVLGTLNILSTAIVPIFVHGAWWGFIGFKECRREREWTHQELDALQVCAGILGAAVQCKQTEKTQAEREKRFRALIQHSSDAAIILDADGTTRYASESVKTLTGHSADEYLGRSAFLLLHPDDLPHAIQEFEALRKSPQGVRRAEYRCITKSGGWVYLEAVGTNCLHDPAVNGFVLNIRNITDRKQAQEALAASERRFRTLVEKSSEGLCLLDAHYTILYQSPSLFSIQGYTPEERNGRHALELVHPDDLTATEAIFDRVRRAPGASSPLSVRLLHKDGSWRWQEASVSNHLDDPDVKALVINFHDVTERKQTEEALHDSEQRLRSLADNLPSAVLYQLVADAQDSRRFTYVSDAVTRVNEVSVEAVLADPLVLVSQTLPEFRPGMEEAVQKALQNGSTFSYEFKAELPSGRIRWFEISTSLRRLTDGRVVAEGVQSDITDRKRVEAALRESEEQYRGIFDESVAAILLFDSAKHFIDCNQAGLDLLGYSRHELAEITTLDLDVDPDAVSLAHESLLAGHRLINYEHRIRCKDGRIVTVLNNSRPLTDPLGDVVGTLSTLVDITELKQAEEALRIARDLSLALGSTDEIHHAAYLILNAALRFEAIDCGGVFLANQDGALDLMAYLGLTPELVANAAHYPADSLEAQLARHSDTVHGVLNTLPTGDNALYKKEGIRGIVVIPVRHQDQFLVLLVLGSHTHDSIPLSSRRALETLGQQVGAILMRLRAAAALHESRQNLHTLFHTVDDFVFVLDKSGRIREVNTAAVSKLGYSRNELLDLDIFALYPPDRRAEAETLLADMLAGNRELSPLPLQTKEGALIPVETHVTSGSWGGAPAIFSLCRDIADRLRAEDEKHAVERQMFHAQKLESLGVLAGGIAHDFNNLLMAILCNIDMALQDVPPSSSAAEFLGEALKSTQRAAALTRQMLAYSGRGHFIVTAVDLADLVRQMAPLLNVSIRKNITLHVETAPSIPLIAADATQLQQVVMNLIINAAEAYAESSPGDISVLVDVRYCTEQFLSQAPSDVLAGCRGSMPADEYVCLTVTDHGCGMSEDTKNHLFDPFFTTKFTGRGLGLAAVLGIIRGHRAALHLESELGKGTTFNVFFPIAKDAHAPRPVEDQPERCLSPRNAATILIVDDEQAVLKVVATLLRRHGYSVLSAANGNEALRLHSEHIGHIDCVLLDLNMPDMDGETVFHELRKEDPNVRVVLASGYDEEENARRFAGLGMTGFLQKPYLPVVLTDKIRSVLASRA